jgi:bla regulator protein blaR1
MDILLDSLLTRLAAASLQTVLFAGFIWALCRFVPTLSAATRSWMWWLVGAQMVVGLCLPGTIELPLLPAAAPTVIVSGDPAMPVIMSVTDMPAVDPADAWAWSWGTALLAAWVVLVAAQVIVGVVRWRRIAGVVSRALPHDDVRLETLCAQRARALGLRRSPRLAVSAEVDSPQVVGMLRPTILLPLDDTFGDDEREMALMHELAHIRRGDLLLGGIPALARTLFFFHPMAHLAVREYALCREAACDALAVDRGRLAAGTYGRLILRLGVVPHPHHALPGASPTFRILKRRLDMLGQSQDARPRVATTLFIASLALAAALPWRIVAAASHVDTPVVAPASELAPIDQAAPAAAPAAEAAPAVAATPAPAAAPAAAPKAAAPAVAVIVDKKTPRDASGRYILPPPPAPPPAPAAPAAPAAPMAPPAPPAPPVSESSHLHTSYSTIEDKGGRHSLDIDERKGYLTITNDDGQWELHDPAYLARIRAIYQQSFKGGPAPLQQPIDPKRAAELDQRQAMLSEQMARLSQRQSELAIAESRSGHAGNPEYAKAHSEIGREQGEIGRQMGEVARERAMHGRTEAEWNREIAEQARKANERVEAVIAEALRNHALTRVN